MACQLVNFRLITNSETRRLKITNLFDDSRDRTISIPYRGLVLLRFEKSLHLGPDSNAVVIRVLKIINPIQLADPTSPDIYVPIPEAERLFLHRKNGQVVVRSWEMNDDSSLVGSALRILPSIHK
ncbi:hypothetical protein H0H93_000493 [Arthromyces matolae]|nr:hypothetical protein H0H93_000493 [Arthromyces matolae]